MAKFNPQLQPNEVVLLKDERIAYNNSGMLTDELILTNLNLIHVQKSAFFERIKRVQVFPLNQIKVFNGQVWAVPGGSKNIPSLEIDFVNGNHEVFSFGGENKKKIPLWISKINMAVTGNEIPVPNGSEWTIPGAGLVAGALKGTVDVFKKQFATPPPAPVSVATNCTGCGAPVSGIQGTAISCEYCGTVQQA